MCNGVILKLNQREGWRESTLRFEETKTLQIQKKLSCLTCKQCTRALNAVASLPFMPPLEQGAYYKAIWCDKKGISFEEVV